MRIVRVVSYVKRIIVPSIEFSRVRGTAELECEKFWSREVQAGVAATDYAETRALPCMCRSFVFKDDGHVQQVHGTAVQVYTIFWEVPQRFVLLKIIWKYHISML